MGGCAKGYHFKWEYWDCTGECVDATLAAASAGATVNPEQLHVDVVQHKRRAEGTINFTAWQLLGWDKGSTVGEMPSAAGLIDLARATLARHV